jgi:hypothetical protein
MNAVGKSRAQVPGASKAIERTFTQCKRMQMGCNRLLLEYKKRKVFPGSKQILFELIGKE